MKNVLVIGGSGFLGSRLATALKQRKVAVHVYDLKPHPDAQINSIPGDIGDRPKLLDAVAQMDTVFQTASLIDWGPDSRERLMQVNFRGNNNIIAACQNQGVRRLIYTSSIDVVFDGHPIRNGNESLPYPNRHMDDYSYTKMLAEQAVIAANGVNGLATCSLRSAGIFGPGDPYRLPGVIASIKSGRMINIGDGKSKFGHVYVDNLVHAHILAGEKLETGSPLAGQCYFINDGNPTNFFNFFIAFINRLGYTPTITRVPAWLAYAIAASMETIAKLDNAKRPPFLTRYIVRSTSEDFYFSHAKATRDFGYAPIVPFEQALSETVEWLKQAGYSPA